MRKPIIWVISPFSDLLNMESSDRFKYICQKLTDKGASVCQFVSAFDHSTKRQRKVASFAWRIVKVFEPGYNRNVSYRRVLSHIVFDLLIFFYFIRESLRSGVPDTIFSVVPHNGAACVAGLFAKAIHAKFIVDIHDTWPESILSIAKMNPVKRVICCVWKACADFVFRCADDVFGESMKYAERADTIRSRMRLSNARAIYISGDPTYYRSIKPIEVFPLEVHGANFFLTYAGTLGENYDLDCILDAFIAFQDEFHDVGLLFLGSGERESHIRSRLSSCSLKAWVSGMIPHRTLLSYLKASHVGLNCFKPAGNVAYSYKLNDYLLAGVPVINSLIGESAEIILTHELGVNYFSGDSSSLLEAMRICHGIWRNNPEWREKVLAFSSQNLDREINYWPLIDRCLNKM
jgi:glycosyltransferase involved in cell wall biosynthesis